MNTLIAHPVGRRHLRPAVRRSLAATLTALLGTAWVLLPAAPAVADTVRDQQWYLTALDIAAAHQASRGEGVTVAVIDTGVDATHPDLQDAVVPGISAYSGSGDGMTDTHGHGTAMAAVIAGRGHGAGNRDGILGIAPAAKVMTIGNTETGDPEGRAPQGTVSKSIDFAASQGVKVISMSFGAAADDQLKRAVSRAQQKDIVLVAAVGNKPKADSISDPAGLPGVVSVAAVDRNGNHAEFSVEGVDWDDDLKPVIAAPGVDIPAARPGGGYETRRFGTSYSTAIVAGAVALIRAKYPSMPAHEVIHRLTATATDRGPKGRDKTYGYGTLNLTAALNNDLPPPATTPPWASKSNQSSRGAVAVTSTPESSAVDPGSNQYLRWVFGAGVAVVLVALAIGLSWLMRRRTITGGDG